MQFPNGDDMYVDIRSGNFYYRATDLIIPTRGLNLSIKRYYNSNYAYDDDYWGWYFNFDERLIIDPYDSSIIVKFAYGKILRFEYDPVTGEYSTTTGDNHYEMSKVPDVTGSYYILTFQDKSAHYFNSGGFLIKEMDTSGNAITYERVANGRDMTRIVDPVGRVISVSQDVNKLIFTDWIGRSYTYEFESGRRLVSYTDPKGNITEYGYRYPGRKAEYDNYFLLQTITYPEIGLFLANTDLGGSPNANKVEYQEFANGLCIKYSYDWDTGVRTVEKGSYDGELTEDVGNGHVKSFIDSRIWTYDFDENWFLEQETDPLGNTTSYTYNSLGQVLTVTDPRGGLDSREYNSEGMITSRSDKLDNTTSYEYDTEFPKNLTKKTLPEPFSYEYDYTYDSETGELLTSEEPGGAQVVRTYYDSGFRKGLLKDVTDANGKKTTYDYDEFGNVTSVTNPLGKTTTYAYDSLGRRISQTDPEGNTGRWVYDIMGNVSKTIDTEGNETIYYYDELNRLLSVVDPAG